MTSRLTLRMMVPAKTIVYVLFMAWLFSMVDWQIIYLTRFSHPEWKDWMHAHERQYASIKGTVELILSTPSIPLKPFFHQAFVNAFTSAEEKKAITHAPPLSWGGFYQPVVRGQPYVFVPWTSWFLRWIGPSLLWWSIVSYFVQRRNTNHTA